jgi:hypothetical protein
MKTIISQFGARIGMRPWVGVTDVVTPLTGSPSARGKREKLTLSRESTS